VEQLGIHFPSLIVYLVNFILLVLILYFVAYKRILALLDSRSERIKNSLDEAEKARLESDKIQEELKNEIAKARNDAQNLLDDARKTAEQYREEQKQKVAEEIQQFMTESRDELVREKQKLYVEIKEHFSQLVVLATEKILHRTIKSEDHNKLIDEVLQNTDMNKEN